MDEYVAAAEGGVGMKTHQRAGLILFIMFWSLLLIALLRKSDPIAYAGLGILSILFAALCVID